MHEAVSHHTKSLSDAVIVMLLYTVVVVNLCCVSRCRPVYAVFRAMLQATEDVRYQFTTSLLCLVPGWAIQWKQH